MKALCIGLVVALTPLATAQHAGIFEHGAVAADHPDASEAGASILRAGGNAVDAAVATSLALSVCRPASCGIGGGGFMVIVLPDDPDHGRVVTAINYRETAAAAVTETFFEDRQEGASLYGGAAVAIPGTVAGLAMAQERYGLLEWSAVVQPAINLAEHGFEADAFHLGSLRTLMARTKEHQNILSKLPEGFLQPDDDGLVRNPDQAKALRLIAEQGPRGFYEGDLAQAIATTITNTGGVISREDLRSYTPVEVEPMEFEFEGRTFVTMPPPSSGGIAMLQTLKIFDLASERLGVGQDPWAWPQAMHVLTEATKHAFADRSRWLADTAFAPVPVDRLTSDEYLKWLADRITLDGPMNTSDYGSKPPARLPAMPLPDDSGTSHLCVVDQWGGAVACTETINTTFGSLVVVPGYGFVLNNEMDDFQARRGMVNAYGLVQSDWNLPLAGRRPLSSMTPTIVLDAQGRVEALAGAAGGPRIITATTQVLLRIVRGMSPGEAVEAKRVHHQWSPDRFETEDEQWAEPMRALGHEVSVRPHASSAQAIGRVRDKDGEQWEAACDPRKGGRPAGY